MATFRRATTPGATYFFTVVTHLRQPLLTHPSVYDALKKSIRSVMRQYPFTIEAFVLLPDHMHSIWTLPSGDADYARRWSIIKRLTSQGTIDWLSSSGSVSRRSRKESGLWQRRFWEHQIRDEADFERHVDYIHWNPVKYGHASTVAEWPYSSFHRFVRRGIYPPDWAGKAANDCSDPSHGEPV